jgi:GT2 family glycosyltransferase
LKITWYTEFILSFPSAVIIIVNYNQVDDTIACIESLLIADAELSQIILVDNASSDQSVNIIREKFGNAITILALKENKGYPYGLNQGIPVGLSKGADWFLLMNNDVIVDQDFLNALKQTTIEKPDADLIGPTILYYDHPDIIWYIGYTIFPGTLIGYRSFRGRKYSPRIPKYLEIDVMHGCTMMVHKKVFQEIGLFDASDIIYGDDADFSFRARNAGFKMIAATRAKMWHKISLTMGKEKPNRRYLRVKNTIAFYRKNSKGLMTIIMFIFTLLKSIVTIAKDLLSNKSHLIKPLFHAFLDGWKITNKERNYS